MNSIKIFLKKVISLERLYKQLIVFLNDCLICIICIWLSFSTRYETLRIPNEYEIIIYIIALLIFIPVFYFFKIYKIIHEHLGFSSLRQIILASVLCGFIFSIVLFIFNFPYIPRSIGVIYSILFTTIILISRITIIYLINEIINVINFKKVLIYGAGNKGINAAKVLERSPNYKTQCFIDEEKRNFGKLINNISIYPPNRLKSLIKKYKINHIVLALEESKQEKINEIVLKIEPLNIEINKIPDNFDFLSGSASVSDFKNLDIIDLIDRKISIENNELKNLSDKIVFVSGAGGSIGSEICRQLIFHQPKEIILFDHSEFNLYTIENELKSFLLKNKLNINLVAKLGSIKDKVLLGHIFKKCKPDFVFHVAAYKHVPMVEYNISEAIINNVLGTENLVEVSIKNHIKDFTLISTDKAVRPTNIMGATKRLAELLLQGISNSSELNINKTTFSIIRFGNVLGSSGSVVPLFYEQIRNGGPITVTHNDITRYFMTIKEAAILVLQSTSLRKKNEIFVLDMGEPIKILDLAKRMIKLSGLKEKKNNNQSGDIEIKITGLRPGEKLYEELILGNNIKSTEKSNILKAQEEYVDYEEVKKIISKLKSSIDNDDIQEIKSILKHDKIGYKPNTNEL